MKLKRRRIWEDQIEGAGVKDLVDRLANEIQVHKGTESTSAEKRSWQEYRKFSSDIWSKLLMLKEFTLIWNIVQNNYKELSWYAELDGSTKFHFLKFLENLSSNFWS